MSEPVRDEAYFQQYVGLDIPKSIYRIKAKGLAAYAKAIGDLNPKYVGTVKEDGEPDYTGIVAHPAYAATYTIPGLFSLGDVVDDSGAPFIKNIGKLLHTGQAYDFSGCDVLTPEDAKIYTAGTLSKIWIKSNILWIEVKLESRNKEGNKLFCKTTLAVGIRPGGY
jgi:hypothetical protein